MEEMVVFVVIALVLVKDCFSSSKFEKACSSNFEIIQIKQSPAKLE